MTVFNIKENLNKLSKISILDQIEYSKAIDNEIKLLLEKLKTTRGYSDLLKKPKNKYYDNALKTTSFVIEYSIEIFDILKTITPKNIDHHTAKILGILLRDDDPNKDNYYNIMYCIRDLIEYYIQTFHEIYTLIENNFINGYLARLRVLLETYCIFKFFLKFPDTIERYIDHSFIKRHLTKIKYSQYINHNETVQFGELKNKYLYEYDNFIKNYGWAGNKIKHLDSFNEIQVIASNGKKDKYDFIKRMYSLLSEYSHSSAFIVYKQNRISQFNILQFLIFSEDMCISIIEDYIDWIFQNYPNMDNNINYLSPVFFILYYFFNHVNTPSKNIKLFPLENHNHLHTSSYSLNTSNTSNTSSYLFLEYFPYTHYKNYL
jgi:hypothetical protein